MTGLLNANRSTFLVRVILGLILAIITVLGLNSGIAWAEDSPREENRILWTKLAPEAVWDAATDPQGNIFVLTYSVNDIFKLIKHDQNGVEKWARTLDQTKGIFWSSVSANHMGEVFVIYSDYTNGDYPNTVLSKFDPEGTLLWAQNLSAHFRGQVFVAAGYQGGVFVAGTNDLTIAAPGVVDAFLGYFDEAGVQQWTSCIGSSGWERLQDIAAGPGGEVYIIGYTDGVLDVQTASGGWIDLFVAAFEADGQEKWIRQFGYGRYSHKLAIPGGIACDQAGNVYFTHGTMGDAFAPSDYGIWRVTKFDSNGDSFWSASLGILANSRERNDIAIDNWGNIYTTGTYIIINSTTGIEEQQCRLVKFDSNGNQLLVKELGAEAGNRDVVPWAPAIGEDGSLILTGYTYNSFNGQDLIGYPDRKVNSFMVKFEGDIDTDGDGLLDRWEINGYQTIDGFVDLPNMGANPKRKDIFVEVDWLAGQKPDPAAIAEVVRKFQEAPITNVDGSTGISLHVDAGRDSTMDPLTGTTWGDYSRANQIPRRAGDGLDFMGSVNKAGEFVWDEFDTLKKAHFGRERSPIFRYCIFAKGPSEADCTFDKDGKVLSSGSGMSRGIPSSDFFVSLGFWGANGPLEQAGTFMHELGHTLGLRHGGLDHVGNKPNYFSIMNYLYQTTGLIYNGLDGFIDYSRFGHIDDLDENHLDETKGITSSTGEDLDKYGLRWTVEIWKDKYEVVSQNDVTTINWDCRNGLERDLAIDINQDKKLEVLTGNFNDWENLSYKGGNVGLGVANALLPTVTKAATPELTSAEDAEIVRPYRVGLQGPGTAAVDRGQVVTCDFTVVNAGSEDDSYTIIASDRQGWADLSGVPAVLDIKSGESSQIQIPVVIPAAAGTGQEESITLTVTSTHNSLMMNRQTATLVVKKKAIANTEGILEKLDLSTLNARLSYPVIHGDKVAFSVTPTRENPYIGIYSLTNKTMVEIDCRKLLTSWERSKNPYVDDIDFNGDYIVWHLYGGQLAEVKELFFADLTGDTPVIIRIGSGDKADLYGNKLVFKDLDGVKTYDLDTRTLTVIPATNYSGTEFVIDGGQLFWRYLPTSGDKKYYMYDLASGIQSELLSSAGTLPRFDVSGNQLVYDVLYGPTLHDYGLRIFDVASKSKREIFFKDYTVDRIRIDHLSGPVMLDNKLATFVYDNNVWLCDLEAEVYAPVTTDGAYENQYYFPKIHKNQIVFSKNGEIYIFTLLAPATAPVTSLSSVPAEDGKNIKITLTPDLPNALTYYQWDADSLESWSQYTSLLNAPEGTHTLYFFSQDGAGTSETVQSKSFTVDTTAPVTTITTNPLEPDAGYGRFTNPPSISIAADEPGSTAYYQWDADGAAGFSVYSDPITGLVGEHTLYYYSVDQSGNREEVKSAVIKVRDNSDTTPSVTTITVDPDLPDDNGWYSEAPKIFLGTGDNASIYYQWDSADNADFNVPMLPEYLLGRGNASSQIAPGWRVYLGEFAPPQGTHTLYYFSVDNAGNVENMQSQTFKTGTEITTPPASNADLAAVSLGDIQYTPVFDANALIYTASVGYGTSQVTVTPAAVSENAVITVNGKSLIGGSQVIDLNVGANVVEILVTAQDGIATRTYRFNIARAGTQGGGTSTSSQLKYSADRIDIYINGLPFAGMAEIKTTTSDGRKVTTAALLSSPLLQYFEDAANGLVLSLLLESDSERVLAQFDGEVIKNLANKAASIEFQQGQAIYTVPAAEIKIEEIAKQLGNPPLQDIKVQIEVSRPAEAVLKVVGKVAGNGQFTVLLPPLEFKITVSYGNQTVEVNSFSTPVKRYILIPENIDRNQISTALVIEKDGTVRHVPTKVVMIRNKYYAQITGFTNSVYVLVNHSREFVDVENHWAQSVVNEMGSRLIIKGTGEGLFTPNAAITRAEFAAIVIKALGLRESDQPSRFYDINKSDWFYGTVTAAVEHGLTTGYTDGTFQPGKIITREEALVVITRALNLAGIDTTMSDADIEKVIAQFIDGGNFGDWSRQAAAYCIENQLVVGNQGIVEPNRHITRAEAAVIVKRMLGKMELISI